MKWIKSLFTAPSQQDELDAYVASKNPSTTAEVEHWVRQYDLHQRKEWAL